MRRARRDRSSPFGLGSSSTAFMVVLLGFLDLSVSTQTVGLAAASLSIPYVNPKSTANGDKKLSVAPVALYARLQWEKGKPHDVDFWVRCNTLADAGKGEVQDANWKSRNATWFDLIKDDVGGPSYLNEEQVQSNSQAEGLIPPNTTCRLNVHLYHSHEGQFPLQGSVLVIQDKDSDQEILVGDVSFSLMFPGQELTILTAVWDERGNLIPEGTSVFPEAAMVAIATATPPSPLPQ